VFEALFDSDTRVTRTAEMLQALCSRLSAENFQYRIAAAEADNTLAYAARQGVGAAIMTVDSDLIFLESSTVTFDELVGHSLAPLDLETISTIGGAFDSTALSSVMHMISDGHGYDSDGEPKLTILPSGAMQFMVGSSDCVALKRTSRLPALQFNQWASQSFAEQLLRPENNGPESSLLERAPQN